MLNILFPQVDIEEQVKVLLVLKSDYKSLTGKDYQPPVANKSSAPVNTSKVKFINFN